MDIAAHVFAAWTHRGVHEAHLADRFLDGSVDRLEYFLTAATAKRPLPDVERPASGSTTSKAAAAAQLGIECGGCLRSDEGTEHLDAPSADSLAQPASGRDGRQQDRGANRSLRLETTPERVDVRNAAELSYDEFVSIYMAANVPVVIRVSLLADHDTGRRQTRAVRTRGDNGTASCEPVIKALK